MKRLFTIDMKNYDISGTRVYRPSVRGIILTKDGKIALVHSKKFHYYKFPGGGIENGENHIEALVREVKEETGLAVIPESVREFGNVLRIQKGDEGPHIIFEQENYYYLCEINDAVGEQNLDEYEEDAQFELEFVTLDEAIRENALYKCDDLFAQLMIDRDRRVLEILKDNYECTCYYSDNSIMIRSMKMEDAKVIYDTYMSYGWHPILETYENYYKEQEENIRKVFIAEYEGEVAGLCTLVLNPQEGPWA